MPVKKTGEMLRIIPFGKVREDTLAQLGNSLTTLFPLDYEIMPSVKIPWHAYDAGRKKYQASALLHKLNEDAPPGTRPLGVTECDLFASRGNFIFGESDMVLGVAVISITRFRQEWYGLPPDNKLLLHRAVSEAMHQLGHTYGLHKCSNPYCAMYPTHSVAEIDRRGTQFCFNCQRQLN